MPKSKAIDCFLISNIVYLICERFEDVNDSINLLTIVESLSVDTYYTVLKWPLSYKVKLPDPYCFSRNCFQKLHRAIEYHKRSNWVFSSIEFDLSDCCFYCKDVPQLCREKNDRRDSLPKLEEDPDYKIIPWREDAEEFISKYDELYSVLFFDGYFRHSKIRQLILFIDDQEIFSEMENFADFKDLYLFLRKEKRNEEAAGAGRISAQPDEFLLNYRRPVVKKYTLLPPNPSEVEVYPHAFCHELCVGFCYCFERQVLIDQVQSTSSQMTDH